MRSPRDSLTVRRVALVAVCLTVFACRASAAPVVDAQLEIATQPGTELAFAPDQVVAPADARVELAFSNASTLAHNLVFLSPIDGATRPIVQPGETDEFEFDTPAAGAYRFVCSIHEDMSGTLQTR